MSPFSLRFLLIVSSLIVSFSYGVVGYGVEEIEAEDTVEDVPEYYQVGGGVSEALQRIEARLNQVLNKEWSEVTSTSSESEDVMEEEEAVEEEAVEEEAVEEEAVEEEAVEEEAVEEEAVEEEAVEEEVAVEDEALDKDYQKVVLENRSLRNFLTTSYNDFDAIQASLPNKLTGCNFWRNLACGVEIAAATAACVVDGVTEGSSAFVSCEEAFLGSNTCTICLGSSLPSTDVDIATIEAGQLPEMMSGNKMMKAVLSTAHAYKAASTLVSGSAQLVDVSPDETCPVAKWLVCTPALAVAYAECLHNPVMGITFGECIREAVGLIDESCLPCCTPAISFMQHL